MYLVGATLEEALSALRAEGKTDIKIIKLISDKQHDCDKEAVVCIRERDCTEIVVGRFISGAR